MSPPVELRLAMGQTRNLNPLALDIKRERSRQIAGIGGNLMSNPGWANTHTSGETVVVIASPVTFVVRCSPWPFSTKWAAISNHTAEASRPRNVSLGG